MELVSLLRGLGVGAKAPWCQGYVNRQTGMVVGPLDRQTEMTGGGWVQLFLKNLL